jgi:hypothetical protein
MAATVGTAQAVQVANPWGHAGMSGAPKRRQINHLCCAQTPVATHAISRGAPTYLAAQNASGV